MDKEELKRLDEIRKYLDVSKNEFEILLLLALKYKNEEGKAIHEEQLYEVVEEALNNMDYHDNDTMGKGDLSKAKSIEEAFNRALINLGYKKSK